MNASELLKAALYYISLGYRVVPNYPGQKRPNLREWPTAAFSTEDEIRAHWTRYPSDNVGILTEGLQVVDIDAPKIGGSHPWQTDQAVLELLQDVPLQITPHGGWHALFSEPEGKGFKNTTGNLAEGVDTRARGGQIVVEPSVFDGKTYKWHTQLVAKNNLPICPKKFYTFGGKKPRQDFKEQLRKRLNIPLVFKDVEKSNMNKTTGQVSGLCPFHNDTNKSFSYDVKKGLWQCFTCNTAGDVFDYIALRDNTANFRETLDVAETKYLLDPSFGAEPLTKDTFDDRPTVYSNRGQLCDRIEKTWEAVLQTNAPPRLFLATGGYLVRLREVNGNIQMQAINNTILRGLLTRMITWLAGKSCSSKDTEPPVGVILDMIANPHQALPRLDAVTTSPVLSPDESLIMTPGHHQASGIYYHKLTGESYTIPPIPSQENITAALKYLYEELLGDFPFATDSDRTHVLAMLLTPLMRPAIEGPTPMFVIEASVQGSGKSLLAEAITTIVTGETCGMMSLPRQEEELRKRITALLCEGSQVITFDNASGKIDSEALASALTSSTWKDRLLGVSESVSPPNKALWVLTTNNAELTRDIARRCVRIRLEPDEESPEERTEFRHDPLLPWVRENRTNLLWAVLVLIQWWVLHSRPRSNVRFGSFESWAQLTGGVLETAGVPDFLGNRSEFRNTADNETGDWVEFVMQWRQRYKDNPVTTRELYDLARSTEQIRFAYVSDKGEKSELMRMGRSLRKIRGRVFANFRVTFCGRGQGGAAKYCLSPPT